MEFGLMLDAFQQQQAAARLSQPTAPELPVRDGGETFVQTHEIESANDDNFNSNSNNGDAESITTADDTPDGSTDGERAEGDSQISGEDDATDSGADSAPSAPADPSEDEEDDRIQTSTLPQMATQTQVATHIQIATQAQTATQTQMAIQTQMATQTAPFAVHGSAHAHAAQAPPAINWDQFEVERMDPGVRAIYDHLQNRKRTGDEADEAEEEALQKPEPTKRPRLRI